VTALQQQASEGRWSRDGKVATSPRRARGGPGRLRGWFARNPAWPIIILLAGWPVWWALGIEMRIFDLMAIPVARQLYLWHATRNRKLRLPPGFGIWLLFLLVMLLSAATLGLQAPGTEVSPVSDRVLSFAARSYDYGAVTVFLLYAGNLTEQELPRRRLAWLLGLVGIYTLAGGMLGVLDPHLGFTSPIAHLLPKKVQAALASSLNPGTAQNQPILGFSEGRVKAPFDYTNTWGNCLAILFPWLLVAWWSYGTRRQRQAAMALLALSVVPVVYSLDRGLWVGIGVAVCYLALRLAARGRLAFLGALCAGLALVALIIVATPLQSLISERLAHGASDRGRTNLSSLAVRDALSSPLLGYGDTRHEQGSATSITVGKTANCPRCGNKNVGGDGQLQLLLITTGFLGAALYVAFFAYAAWRYRRDTTPYGMAGVLVILLGFVFMFVYEAGGPPLGFTMLAYALLWRNDRQLQQSTAPAETGERRVPAIIQGQGMATGMPA
jgi:hypothetical protein